MRPTRIRRIAVIAAELSDSGDYEAALALRWIAYEALIARAAIKALWMRGATVKEAENVITRLPPRSPTSLLADCCGNSINLNDSRYSILKHIKDRSYFRNLLFHQLNVASKKQLVVLSKILACILTNPNVSFGQIPMKISGMQVFLGDPLLDLRRLKRKPRVKRRSVAQLLNYKQTDLQTSPSPTELTQDELVRLFTPITKEVVERGRGST
jgi:hypothetical protein